MDTIVKFGLIALVAYIILGMAGIVSLAPIDALVTLATKIIMG